jgi:HK97 family phage portal protein
LSLISGIFEGAFQLRADVSGAPAPWDNFWYEPAGGQSSSAGMRVTPESSKRLSTVIACVSAKSRQLAMLPFKIYADMPKGGKRVIKDHPVHKLIYFKPNLWQTPFEFKQMMQAHVELRGNAYAEIFWDNNGVPVELVPLHPDRITVEIIKSSGDLRYVYRDPLTDTNRVLLQDEVFHLRDFCDVLAVGQSRIRMALDPLGVALARQDYIARFLKNDARTGWVVTGANFKTKDDEELFRKNLQAGGTGENRGKAAIMPAGVDIKSLGVTPVDAQLIEGHKASQVEICTIFNVLPHLVGVDAGKAATYASVEQFNIMNAVQSVLPMAIMWEQAIQRCLLTSQRYYAKGSMASFLRGDTASRFAAYHVAIGDGWMSQDEVRELEDMNPIADGVGANYWRPVNWAPLKQLTTSQPSGKVGGPGGSPGKDGKDGSADEDDDQADETGGGGDSAAKARLTLMASASADRCVRREVNGVKRLIETEANGYQVTEFYAEQVRFILGVFPMLDAATQLAVKVACDNRAQHLTMLLDDEDDEFFAGAQVWIDTVAASEPPKLATLVVEGAK